MSLFNFFSNKDGLSTVVGFSIVLMILIACYTTFQAVKIPQICSNIELEHFKELLESMVDFLSNLKKSCFTSSTTSIKIKLSKSYPIIPFFSTPSYFSCSVVSYNGEIRIKNAIATNNELRNVFDGKEIVWKCKNLKITPNYLFSTSRDVIYEYGLVGAGKTGHVAFSKLIKGNVINLYLLNDSIQVSSDFELEDVVYCISGGGKISITSNGLPIEIKFKSNLSLETWNESIDSKFIEELKQEGEYIVVKLAPKTVYLLSLCVFGFYKTKISQHYLIRMSPKIQVAPCNLMVEVRDIFNNPVPNSLVVFKSLNKSCILCNGSFSGFEVSEKSNFWGIAGISVKSCKGQDTIVASIKRKDGSSYEIAFLVF